MKKPIKHPNCMTGCHGSCCLRVKDLTVVRGDDTLLDQVSFHMHCGELIALIGPNGAGKSTLFKSLLGQYDYTGTITYQTADGKHMKPRIGYVPQSPTFDAGDPVTVLDLFTTAISNYPVFRSQFNNNIGSYIGISMSFPLFNRLSGLANVKQARNNALIAEEEYEAQKEELKKVVQQAVQDRENYLRENDVELIFGWECEELIMDGETCLGVSLRRGNETQEIMADHTVVATGRRGADWLEKLCAEHGIAHQPGTVDIGVRVECRNEVMEEVNRVLYESKLIGYPGPFKNKVRTFCQNPGGFVSQENYDNDLAVVNGHSYKDLKSNNTNVSVLCSHNFSVPFNQPIAYAQKVGELTNMLANGHILVQRFGDILDGKRTWAKELAQSNVRPTLPDAVAGDITAAMPYRAMTNIINFIQAMDIVVPGFAAAETLLYSPELKFYSNRVKMDENLNTNVRGLHCLGDSSGWTRGLMMASAMGVLMGRKLMEE